MTTSTIRKGEGKVMTTKKYQKKEHTPKRLRKYRMDNGYTIYSLAERMGVSYSSVSYWETGEKKPKHERILELEDIFGVGYRELFADLTPEEIKDLENRKHTDTVQE